jgi:hypothetical protein
MKSAPGFAGRVFAVREIRQAWSPGVALKFMSAVMCHHLPSLMLLFVADKSLPAAKRRGTRENEG